MNNIYITDQMLSQLKLPKEILIRKFTEADFPLVQRLYKQEGWMTFIKRGDDGLKALKNSSISLVAVDGDLIVGLIRALTDGEITTYIAEIVVDNGYRGKGLGRALLDICHILYPNTRLDLLSAEHADEFYKRENFRENVGFRKSFK